VKGNICIYEKIILKGLFKNGWEIVSWIHLAQL
jgi:hypothetical protein